jgi:hypothetical protein
VTVREPDWTDEDRSLVLALLAEQRETCSTCGHQMSECRDPRTAGRWQVLTEVCQPGRVAQAVAEDNREARGLHVFTRRTGADL